MAYRDNIQCKATEAEEDADIDKIRGLFFGNGHCLHHNGDHISMGIGTGNVLNFDHLFFCLLLRGGALRFAHKDF